MLTKPDVGTYGAVDKFVVVFESKNNKHQIYSNQLQGDTVAYSQLLWQ